MRPGLDVSGPLVGWLLAAAAVASGYALYGWQGALLGVTVVVFWLLLQFSRTLRVLREAAGQPVGSVRSAVMLNARLKSGMTMAQVLALTGSIGVKAGAPPSGGETEETWRWEDAGGVSMRLAFRMGRLVQWELERPQAGS